MAKFKKRPVVVEAEQYTGELLEGMYGSKHGGGWKRCPQSLNAECPMHYTPHVHTLHGPVAVEIGAWVVKGADDYYPVADATFRKTFDALDVGPGESSSTEVGHKDGQVVMNCGGCDGVPPHWTAWTPAQARQLARKIEAAAANAEGRP